MRHLPFPWVIPLNEAEYPNMSFKLTSTTAVNSSSLLSVSWIVPRLWFKFPTTLPVGHSKITSAKARQRGSGAEEEGRKERTRRTLELGRSDDLDRHDGLEDDGSSLEVSLSEGVESGGDESQLGRINSVETSILEDVSNSGDGGSVQSSPLQSLSESLSTPTKEKQRTVSPREKGEGGEKARDEPSQSKGCKQQGSFPP